MQRGGVNAHMSMQVRGLIGGARGKDTKQTLCLTNNNSMHTGLATGQEHETTSTGVREGTRKGGGRVSACVRVGVGRQAGRQAGTDHIQHGADEPREGTRVQVGQGRVQPRADALRKCHQAATCHGGCQRREGRRRRGSEEEGGGHQALPTRTAPPLETRCLFSRCRAGCHTALDWRTAGCRKRSGGQPQRDNSRGQQEPAGEDAS